MKSIEDLLQADADAGREFWDDCTAVFSAGAGARVMLRLCQLAHPLDHSPLADPVLGAQARGRAEMVAALWRRSQAAIEPQDVPRGCHDSLSNKI